MAAKGRKPGSKKRAAKRTSVRTHLSPWARDAAGIALVVVAILSALSLWFDAGGIAGRAIEYLSRGAVGVAAVTLPVLLLFWGFLLIKGSAEQERVALFQRRLATPVGELPEEQAEKAAERIGYPTNSITVELIGKRLELLRSRCDRLIEQRIGVLNVEVEVNRRTSPRLWAEVFRKTRRLLGHHER